MRDKMLMFFALGCWFIILNYWSVPYCWYW